MSNSYLQNVNENVIRDCREFSIKAALTLLIALRYRCRRIENIRLLLILVYILIEPGEDYAKHNTLMPLTEDYDNGYDVNLNPTTFASFTAGAYRALHSYVQGYLK